MTSAQMAMASPLDPVLGRESDLPAAFRRQFLTPPGGNHVRVEGVMSEIWHPAWLGPVFRFLGRFGVLVPASGRSIPTTLEVVPGRDASGRPQQEWNRTFWLSATRSHRFDTVVIYDERIGAAVDLVGPGGVLYLAWEARFIAPDTLTIRRSRCGLRFRERIVWLPQWLWPWLLGRERFQQRVDAVDPDRIHIELVVGHPLFGDVFLYRGAFRVSLEPG